MKQITAITAVLLLTLVVGFATVQPVRADGTEAQQETETTTSTTVECSTGSYGQNVNCTATADATASAKQKVYVRADGTVIEKHETAAASLDAQGLAAVASTLMVGAAGVAIKLSTRA